MRRYVLGFVFDEDLRNVVLIRVGKGGLFPGMYNGLGGKIEPGEAPVDAMRREFHEEAGICVPVSKWAETITMEGDDGGGDKWSVICYRATVGLKGATFPPDVALYSADELPLDVVPNLRWLIPLHRFHVRMNGVLSEMAW